MEITIDGWVYVHVNYDYRYTDNASRSILAKRIFDMLRIANEETSK